VNVGVIVAGEDGWAFRRAENLRRARAIDTSRRIRNVEAFFEMLEQWEDETPDGSPLDWLDRLHGSMRNTIVVSSPLPVLARSAEAALAELWPILVVDPVSAHLPYLRRSSAVSLLRRAYRAHLQANVNLFEQPRIKAGDEHALRSDFAVANGVVSELTHAFSFQLPNEEMNLQRIRSWGYAISVLRDEGGLLAASGGRLIEVPPNVDVHVLCIPPSSVGEAVYDEARAVFARLDVKQHVATRDESEAMAIAAANRLAAA
jgi:hypothetical protein